MIIASPAASPTEQTATGAGAPEGPFTVVIADDDEGVRDALSGLFEDHDDLELVGVGIDGRQAAGLCRDHRPDLAVLDLMMPFGDVEAIEAVTAASPATLIVFHTARADRRTRDRLIEAGATEVFGKGQVSDLCAALCAVAEAR